MKLTPIFKFKKRELTDVPDISATEDNWDNLETVLLKGSNRNFLDNPWFTVNQRSLNQYSGSMYTVDRWIEWMADDECTVSSDGVSLSCSSTYINFAQLIDTNIKQILNGKTLTASVMDFDGNVYSGTFVALDGLDLNVAFIKNDTRINMWLNPDGYWEFRILGVTSVNLRAVKLEIGEVSTLKNDVAPDYASELLKCQRYFYRTQPECRIYGQLFTTGFYVASYELPIIMRTYPAVSILAWDDNWATPYVYQTTPCNIAFSTSDASKSFIIHYFEASAEL